MYGSNPRTAVQSASVPVADRVRIYWNLHKKCYSVCDARTGKVVQHRNNMLLKDCELRVQPGGRRRVLETRSKSVHAFVCGTPTNTLGDKYGHGGFRLFGYNPYKYDSFVALEDERPVKQADLVLLTTRDGAPVCKGVNLR